MSFRGVNFQPAQRGQFSTGLDTQPDGQILGSGLTVLVGPNGGGKSSLIELLANVGAPPTQDMSLKPSMRNSKSDGVEMTVATSQGQSATMRNSPEIPRLMQWDGGTSAIAALQGHLYVVPPRRQFDVFFGRVVQERPDYAGTSAGFRLDRQNYPKPVGRLIRLSEDLEEKKAFDEVLTRILGYFLDWKLDVGENNQYFIRVDKAGGFHDSDGMGFGVVSLLFILDSLRDLAPGDIVVVDEPELSLHPAVQRRLAAHLLEAAKAHQVIVATHSPYFADIAWVHDGAQFARVATGANGSKIFQMSDSIREKIRHLGADVHNPHVLGLEAREFLFLDDAVVLTEGQEDALLLPRLAHQIGKELEQPLYGWGVGGADKMPVVCLMLRDFGLTQVIGLLDRDRKEVAEHLQDEFPDYKFFVLPADDIRDKPARKATSAKAGLADSKGKIHPALREEFSSLIDNINGAFEIASHE